MDTKKNNHSSIVFDDRAVFISRKTFNIYVWVRSVPSCKENIFSICGIRSTLAAALVNWIVLALLFVLLFASFS